MEIKIKLDHVEMGDFSCPFLSDVNSCNVCASIGINGCCYIEDGDADYPLLRSPENCPLRVQAVCVVGLIGA